MPDADHETPEAPERAPAVPFDEPVPQPDEPAPQPKSAYELPSKKNTILRNMVWALVLTMAVVVVVGIAFFGVGSEPEREPLANSELDIAASAERAGGVAPFPVAVPAVDEGWTERSARYTAGPNPRWTLEYSSPNGELITLFEESELGAPMLSSAISGNTVEEEFELEGARCSLLRGGEQGATEHGIACEGEDWGFVVHGDAERAALEQFARATITSLD
ncbi:MAG: DUF4245 family protein [Brachybacterium sp.]|nr:DUF4245 family protein [Brachybacterium sp.]